MSRKTRTLLLGAFAVVFLVATPFVVLLSQGYAFDIASMRFVRTGALFVKTSPQDITLAVNGAVKPVKNLGILYNGTLVKNLIPGTYHVSATDPLHPGVSWSKDLVVEPLVVTKVSRIALPDPSPRIRTFTFATSSPSLLVPGDEYTAVYTVDGKTLERIDVQTQTVTPVADLTATSLISKTETMTGVSISKNLDQAVITTQSRTLFFFAGTFANARQYLAAFLAGERKAFADMRFVWHPNRNNTLIMLGRTGGYFLNTETGAIQRFTSGKVLGLSTNRDGLYYLDASGNMLPVSLVPGAQTPVASIKQYLASGMFWNLYELGDNLVAAYAPTGPLLLVNTGTHEVQELASAADAMRISPDQTRIAYAQNGTVALHFIKDVFDDVRYAAGQTITLGAASAKVLDLFFANDSWDVLAREPDGVELFEEDSRPPVNSWRVALPGTKTFFFANTDTVFWIQKNALMRAQILGR